MIAYGGNQGSARDARIAWMLILLIIMMTWGALKPEAQFWYGVYRHYSITEKVNLRVATH